MPSLFENAKDLLDDLGLMKEDPEAAPDAVDVDPEIATKLGQFSERTQSELTRTFQTALPWFNYLSPADITQRSKRISRTYSL